ncbi:MAG: hypothetical protein SF182_27820 [Deltaproteobacteria bacterium]|nr:hypothetical protein [Deltaproteobacteria bacterium]
MRLGAIERRVQHVETRPRLWLLVALLLPALPIRAWWYATPDGVAYLSIARRLAAGLAPARLGDAQLGYPLGYPLLISPAFWVDPRPWLTLAIMHWGLAALFLLGVQGWARRQLGAAGVWVTLLCAVNVNVWILYRRTLSEAAFCAVLPWTVLALDRVLDALVTGARARRALCAAAPLLLLLIAIREVGLLFAVGAGVAAAVRLRRGALPWRRAVPALAGIAAVAVLGLGVIRPERIAAAGPVFAGRAGDYADAAVAVGTTLAARVYLRMTEIGQLLVPGMFKAYGDRWLDLNTLVYAPLVLLVAIGWWRLWRDNADVLSAAVPLYIALFLAWPYAAGTRYLLPLLPVWWAALWRATAAYPHRRAVFAGLALAHLGVAIGYVVLIDAPRARVCDAQWPMVEQVTAEVGSDPLRAIDTPDCVRLMLEVARDRPVDVGRGSEAAPPSAVWVLAPRDVELSEAFAVESVAGGYQLARRR